MLSLNLDLIQEDPSYFSLLPTWHDSLNNNFIELPLWIEAIVNATPFTTMSSLKFPWQLGILQRIVMSSILKPDSVRAFCVYLMECNLIFNIVFITTNSNMLINIRVTYRLTMLWCLLGIRIHLLNIKVFSKSMLHDVLSIRPVKIKNKS